jgi:hypothetical protein
MKVGQTMGWSQMRSEITQPKGRSWWVSWWYFDDWLLDLIHLNIYILTPHSLQREWGLQIAVDDDSSSRRLLISLLESWWTSRWWWWWWWWW